MGWYLVLVKHSGLALPLIRSCPHSFTKGSQNVDVIILIDCLNFREPVNIDNSMLVLPPTKNHHHHGFEFLFTLIYGEFGFFQCNDWHFGSGSLVKIHDSSQAITLYNNFGSLSI